MFDSFDREITYLRISVTDLCNLRCTYCMPAEGVALRPRNEFLSYESVIEIARAAAGLGLTKIRLTGGEPLVKKDIDALIRGLKAVPGVREVALTTNGTLLAPLAARLKAAGLDRINISLDTLDAEKYRDITRGGDIRAALRGIDAALAAGFANTKINMVLIPGVNLGGTPRVPLQRAPGNPAALPPFSGGAWTPPCDQGGTPPWNPQRAAPRVKTRGISPLVNEVDVEEMAAFCRDKGLALQRIHHYSLRERGEAGDPMEAERPHACAHCNRIRLTADGKLKPCLFSDAEVSVDFADIAASLARAVREKPARGRSCTVRGNWQIGG